MPPPGQAAVRRARAAVTGSAKALEHIDGTAASLATWMYRTNVGTFCSSAAFEAWFRGSSGGDERRSRRRGAPLRRRRDPREAGRDAPRRGVAGGAAGGVEGRGPAPHRTSPAPPRFYDRPAPACATTDDAARDASRSRAACCAHALKGRTGRYNKSHGIVNSRHPPISRTPRLQGRGVLATSC